MLQASGVGVFVSEDTRSQADLSRANFFDSSVAPSLKKVRFTVKPANTPTLHAEWEAG